MRALYLWDSEYPWDIRVEKTCKSLIADKWDVHLVCRNRQRMPTEENYEGIFLHRIPCLSDKLGKLNDIFTFPFFFSPVWLIKIYQVAKKYNVDIIIARDLPMALAAILIARLKNIPVVLDMAECYPELIRLVWEFEPFKLKNIILKNTIAADFVEYLVLRNTDHIFVMVEESRKRLINKNISAKKISIVSNTPLQHKFTYAKATFPGMFGNKQKKLRLLYVGLLNYSRGLDTVLDALKEYLLIEREFFLLIIGTGSASDYLVNLVSKYGLDKYVGFEGWVDNKFIPEYVASSDVCLVPHHKCSHWDNTIPNKLFDYMASGKPVLSSNAEPVRRIIQKTNCGLVYEDYNNNSFISQLGKLREQKIRDQYGKNGVKAVNDYYNWNNDSTIMLEHLKGLVK